MNTQINRFRPYEPGDLCTVWENLRLEDKQEFDVVGLSNPAELEVYITTASLRLTTWETEGGPVAVLGVTPGDVRGVGQIWAIASTFAEPRWRFAVRHTPALLDHLGQGFNLLSNFKDSRNTRQINWLRRLGFTFFRSDVDFCGTGLTFHQFVRIVP
jgi:hypothetical protein